VTYVNRTSRGRVRRFRAVEDGVEADETVSIMENHDAQSVAQGEVDLAIHAPLRRARETGTPVHGVSDYVEYYRARDHICSVHRIARSARAMGAMNCADLRTSKYYSEVSGASSRASAVVHEQPEVFVYPFIDEQKRELVTLDNLQVLRRPAGKRYGYPRRPRRIVSHRLQPRLPGIYAHDV